MTARNAITWCVAIYPNAAWAHRVYPELDDGEALSMQCGKNIFSFLYMTPGKYGHVESHRAYAAAESARRYTVRHEHPGAALYEQQNRS
jgi:leucyl aminopeptidase (aminopeptidase T)